MHRTIRFTLAAMLLTLSMPAAHAQTTPAPADSDQQIREELQQLKDLIQQQNLQLQKQQQEIDSLQKQLQPPAATAQPAAIAPGPAASIPITAAAKSNATGKPVAASSQEQIVVGQTNVVEGGGVQQGNGVPYPFEQESPIYLRIGSATFTPGGWVDFTSIYRTTDVGSGFTTALASIPYSNTVQGGLSENRLTAANSRLSLRADETIGSAKVYGYAEADFNGYQPANAYVSTNSDSLRLRVFYLNLTAGKWDILGGQSWSLLTPNRSGLSPFLSEIYNTVHLDTAYSAGMVFARQAQIRAVYHFTPNFALGLSAENPEQYSGSTTTFPALFSTSETDLNSSSGGTTATPNLHPDVIAKLAYDHKFDDHNWHLEVAGLLTPVAVITPASVTKSATAEDRREGGGVAINGNLEIFHDFHLIADTFWSDGGGRYIGALGPQFVVAQYGSTTSPFSAELIHAGAGLGGFEYQATKTTLISLLYGGSYFGRYSSIDPSTDTRVGYGYIPTSLNSTSIAAALSQNRYIQEGSFATVTNVFHRPSYGAVQVITQFSYIDRTPWYVPAGQPKNAHLFENYFDIRYVLP